MNTLCGASNITVAMDDAAPTVMPTGAAFHSGTSWLATNLLHAAQTCKQIYGNQDETTSELDCFFIVPIIQGNFQGAPFMLATSDN